MVDSHITYSSSYDEQRKIWSGEKEKFYYDKNRSIGDIIFEEMRRHPMDIYQISDSEKTTLTREEMLVNAVRIATYLRDVGITQDDIIASTGRNSTHMAALAFACFFNGTAIHTLNPNYEEGTFRHLFLITKPKIIFCDVIDYEKVSKAAKGTNAKVFVMGGHSNTTKAPSIVELLETPYDTKFRPSKLAKGSNQTLAILCSSGTTGIPKAVTISNSHRIFSKFEYLHANDVQYSPSTLDWLSGVITLITSAVFGSTRIITERPFDPQDFLQMVTRYKITWTVLTPPHIGMLLNCAELSVEKLDSIKSFLFGGSGCALETQKAIKRFVRNGYCMFGYGCTELGHIVSLNTDVDDNKELGSVGVPMPGISMKIIDEQGESLGKNQLGEVCCRNDQFWAGYYGNEEATRQIKDTDGWLHLGDLGYFDDNHNLFVIDRKKDMLKYMNIMYYPKEIEEIIAQIPDAIEVCVFGIWDDCVGDAAAAAVVKRNNSDLTETDIVNFVQQHVTAKYKELNAGAVILKELKKTANGKLDRKAIKEQYHTLMSSRSPPECGIESMQRKSINA